MWRIVYVGFILQKDRNQHTETNQDLVYQENIIAFLQQICGLSGSEADTVRRGIAKKNMDILQDMLPRIVDGYCSKSDKPREVAEGEVKEFLKIIEDASSYMFGKNHSIAYCLIGYTCAYLRYYYPQEFITCYLNCASTPEDVAKGTELAEVYGIRIVPPKYGVSTDVYCVGDTSDTIAKGLSSIKYMSATVAHELLDISKAEHPPKTFSQFLLAAEHTSLDSRQLESLIKIDFFSEFGNQPELFAVLRMFDFFKGGTAKSIKKAAVTDDGVREIIERHTNSKRKDGSEAASYKFESDSDVIQCIAECESAIMAQGIRDLDMRVKIQNSVDILGYVGVTTGRQEDRRRLIVTELAPVKSKNGGDVWAYRFTTKSLGSGKTARLTVRSSLYRLLPFRVGDILFAKDLWKNKKGYWYLQSYTIE